MQGIGGPIYIAVVDDGRERKAFTLVEETWLGNIEVAIDKAFISSSFLKVATAAKLRGGPTLPDTAHRPLSPRRMAFEWPPIDPGSRHRAGPP